MVSVPDVILWCDVQLTKDEVGICLPDLRLNNATDGANVLAKNRSSVYVVNGVHTEGLFTVDFNSKDLENVTRKFNVLIYCNLKYYLISSITMNEHRLFITKVIFRWSMLAENVNIELSPND